VDVFCLLFPFEKSVAMKILKRFSLFLVMLGVSCGDVSKVDRDLLEREESKSGISKENSENIEEEKSKKCLEFANSYRHELMQEIGDLQEKTKSFTPELFKKIDPQRKTAKCIGENYHFYGERDDLKRPQGLGHAFLKIENTHTRQHEQLGIFNEGRLTLGINRVHKGLTTIAHFKDESPLSVADGAYITIDSRDDITTYGRAKDNQVAGNFIRTKNGQTAYFEFDEKKSPKQWRHCVLTGKDRYVSSEGF
jgi:hypothetical protein